LIYIFTLVYQNIYEKLKKRLINPKLILSYCIVVFSLEKNELKIVELVFGDEGGETEDEKRN